MKIKHYFSLTKLAKQNFKNQPVLRNWCSQPGMLAGSFLEAAGQYNSTPSKVYQKIV